MAADWAKPEYRAHLGDKKLYLGYEETCILLKNDEVVAIDILNCRHEEARLIFHANHAANCGHKNVVLAANDTDLMIIGVALASEISGTVIQKKKLPLSPFWIVSKNIFLMNFDNSLT